jgi:hypothetical protein
MEGIERQDYDWDDGTSTYLEDHSWTLARDGSGDAPQQGGFHV